MINFWLKDTDFFWFSQFLRCLTIKSGSDIWFIGVCSLLINFWLKNMNFFWFSQLLRSLTVKCCSNIWSVSICSLLIYFWLKNMNFFWLSRLLHHPKSVSVVENQWFRLREAVVRSVSWIAISRFWRFRWWLTYNIVPLWKAIDIINCCPVNPGVHSVWIDSGILFLWWGLNKRFSSFWRELISGIWFSWNMKFYEIVDISINVSITNIG